MSWGDSEVWDGDDLIGSCCKCGCEVRFSTKGMPDVIVPSGPAWCSKCHNAAPCKHCRKPLKLHQEVESRKSSFVCKGYKGWFSPALE